MKGPKIELFRSHSTKANSQRWYFRKRSANGKIVAGSQGYKQKRYAMVAIKREHPGLPIEDIIKED